MRNKISVYIADDHHVVRRGMVRLLKSFEMVGEVMEAENGKDLISLIKEKVPDAVILDIEMPVMGGIEAVRYISEHFSTVKILVLTMHVEKVFVNRGMEHGAHGFLCKSSKPEELENALASIIAKDFYKNGLSNSAFSKENTVDTNSSSKLSTREIEILLLICQELSPGEISERLHISEKTFFNHRANILKKANVRSNVGLVKFARNKGYVTF